MKMQSSISLRRWHALHCHALKVTNTGSASRATRTPGPASDRRKQIRRGNRRGATPPCAPEQGRSKTIMDVGIFQATFVHHKTSKFEVKFGIKDFTSRQAWERGLVGVVTFDPRELPPPPVRSACNRHLPPDASGDRRLLFRSCQLECGWTPFGLSMVSGVGPSTPPKLPA